MTIDGGSPDTATILANQSYQTVTGPKQNETFDVASYNDTLNGEGGSDLFSVQNTAHWYNSYSDLPGGSATLQAGAANAFIGLTNFAPGNGVTTIDTNGYAGVEIGGNGSSGKLDLSGVTIDGAATILANQSYQTVIGTEASDTFALSSYSDTISGNGGANTFELLTGLSGTNTLTDFNSNDTIDLSALSNTYSNFSLLSSHMTELAGNAVIDLEGGRKLTLDGVNYASLTASEFKFS